MSASTGSPEPSPKTTRPDINGRSSGARKSDPGDPNTSYFLIRRASKRTDNSSSELSPSNGSSRTMSPWAMPTTPMLQTSQYGTPGTIHSSVSDWNSNVPRGIGGAGDPPRPAIEGFEWVWFPEGYWAEREMPESKSKKTRSRSKWFKKESDSGGSTVKTSRRDSGSEKSYLERTGTTSSSNTTPSSYQSLSRSSTVSKNASNRSRLSSMPKGLQYLSPTYPHFVSPDGDPEGLYCKTKRNLGLGTRERLVGDESSVLSTPSNTGYVLQGASNYLRRVKRERNPEDGLPSNSDDASMRRKIGIAPWHRRGSSDTQMSASSSVRKLIMGKTPPATPLPKARYTGSSGQEYMKVEISNPFQPEFLPSEARRIETPDEEPKFRHSSRGYFPGSSTSEEEDRAPTPTFRPSPLSRTILEERIDKYDQILNPDDWSPTIRHCNPPKRSPTAFEITIPEHLPSSLLCPMNPKHKSGGTGICPFHGRRKSEDS